MEDCLFCKIVNKEIATEFVYEDNDIVAFKDVHPLAPVHILIIPRKHIASVVDLTEKEVELMGKIILTAKRIADNLGVSRNGYKLLLRVGDYGGQEVNHIHLHLIGGSPLYEDIHSITKDEK